MRNSRASSGLVLAVGLALVGCGGSHVAADAAVVTRDVAAQPDVATTVDAPADVFDADGVAVTALVVTPSRADVGATIAVTYTLTTSHPVTFVELAAAVRDSTAVDDAHLDFAHHTAVTIAGSQTFHDTTTPDHADTYGVHVAYTLDGAHWVHVAAPAATFVLASGDGGTAVDAAAPDAGANPLGSVGARSGLAWNSGVFPVDRSGSAASYLTEFEIPEMRRGRLCDIEQAAMWNPDWPTLIDLGVLGLMNTLAVSVVDLPPFPTDGSWAQAASGAYDTYYEQLGARVVARRPGRPTVLRLAWEFNGSWYPHHADGSFVAGWQRAVTHIRAGAGAQAALVKVSWSLAALDTSAGFDPLAQLWPGEAYVDFVGVDIYDWPASTPTNFAFGSTLDQIDAFARAHGRMVAIEEWGLHHTGASGDGGDNPVFIHDMFGWIRAHAADLVYEQYFQDDAPTNVNSSLFSTDVDNNPNARAAYLAELH